MAVLPILNWPDSRLATVCDPVPDGIFPKRLVADMFETMYAAPGRGLAAPQVGVLQRLFVTDTTWKDREGSQMVFVNPHITHQSPTLAVSGEGCLSIPGITVEVARPDWIMLDWTQPDGARNRARFEGFAAACVQHELDHLDGIVTLDRLDAADRTAAEEQYRQAQLL